MREGICAAENWPAAETLYRCGAGCIDMCAVTFDRIGGECGTPTICVPGAGITRDEIAANIDKVTKGALAFSEPACKNSQRSNN